MDKPKPQEKNCQSCLHQASGFSHNYLWQECTKGWGKPMMIGVVKNMCGMYQPKK
jgi:hypothetical protein